MLKLTEQNIIEALGCPEDWDIPAIFEEIYQAYCLDSSHYEIIKTNRTVTFIDTFTYEWRAGTSRETSQKVHSERLYCNRVHAINDELCRIFIEDQVEYEDFEMYVAEKCPLISTEYYI